MLHITHAKAGSTWIVGILQTLFGRRVVPRQYGMPDFKKNRGKVLSVFLSRDDFMMRPELAGSQRFIVLRDLRDTLVSRYFSTRNSHPLDPAGKIQAARAELCALPIEEGLSRLMEHEGMMRTARIQQSWLHSGEIVLWYEDLIADDVGQFEKLFNERLKLKLSAKFIRHAVELNRFEAIYRRKPGEEDVHSHGRKGVAGDWRNYFTPELEAQFQDRFGSLLTATEASAGRMCESSVAR